MPSREPSSATSLRSRLVALEEARTKTSGCPFTRLLDTIVDQEERDLLARLVEDDQIALTAIHAELRAEGFSIARDSLRYHRNKVCACYQGTFPPGRYEL